MNTFARSKQSKQDIEQIIRDSLKGFGEAQTLKYMAGLNDQMQLLADHPDIGRDFVHSRSNRQYLYFHYESHVIYYRKRQDDIFITRILHKKMIPEKHL